MDTNKCHRTTLIKSVVILAIDYELAEASYQWQHQVVVVDVGLIPTTSPPAVATRVTKIILLIVIMIYRLEKEIKGMV